ncbi:MAG: class E sortase [Thermoleophilaceae bacterium]|nr:class E sortase [Thermoleophilaceae bacterium]
MTRLRAHPIRVVLRFVASVMMVSGFLLISDAVITLAWQEPVSAYFSERQQVKLEKALIDPPARVVRKEPLRGDALGKLRLPTIGVSEYVVEGTDAENLRKGPGHYPDTPLPGQRGTVAIAGHRTTYGAPFRNIDKLKKNDRIVVELPYGTFVYRVDRTRIVDDSALWVTKRVDHDQLILTACHPLYSAAQRIVAFARLTQRRPATVRKA